MQKKKKTKTKTKTLQSECLIKFALKNVVLNDYLFIFSLFDVDQLYETHLLEKIINDKSNNP
jgi:hypothetical protein